MRSINEFDELSVAEVLEHDPRPTFVVDLDPDRPPNHAKADAICPIFCNEALRLHHRLLDLITGDAESENQIVTLGATATDFRAWVTSVTTFDDSKDVYPLVFHYQDLLWTASTVRRRWRLISGNQCYQASAVTTVPHSARSTEDASAESCVATQATAPASGRVNGHAVADQRPALDQKENVIHGKGGRYAPATDVATPAKETVRQSNHSSTGTISVKVPTLNLSAPSSEGVPDCTVSNVSGKLSPHMIFFRSINWKATPLGSMRKWSREMRQAVNLVMGNSHPAALFLGSEMTMIYNEAYAVRVAGNKHPTLMGTGFAGPFREVWEGLEGLFHECARTGKSICYEDQQLFIDRYGYLEETFYSWSFTPLYGGTDKIMGFYNAPFETTVYCLAERRMQTLQRLGQVIVKAKNTKEFWACVLEGLEENALDIPFAILYSVSDAEETDEGSIASGSAISLKSCHFEGSIAVPATHPAAPHKLDLKRSREGFIPSFREAMRTREPTKLQTRDGTLPEALLDGIAWRGHGDPCQEAIILPLRPTNHDAVMSFLVLGVNPRRPYDDAYKSFITLMNRQLATALASVLLFEEEIHRRKTALANAASEQHELNQQLAFQTSRMQRMAANSSLGMFCISPSGLIIEANDQYYEMTRQRRDLISEMCWLDQLKEASVDCMNNGWKQLTEDRQPWSAELQLNRTFVDPQDPTEVMDYWVLANSYPEINDAGELVSVMGSITNISHLKWAQGLQDRRLLEAEETRRQQNEFIDITSHEMRNPLSAILQCADDIAASLTGYRKHEAEAVIEDCIESAKIISLCVQHQKSIVDDILTVSKLDSNLLVLTPVLVDPVSVMRQTLKMFDSELSSKKIQFTFHVHASFKELNVDKVVLDPSRMSQIVINFMTNAIKFTSERKERKITVWIGVSESPPNPTNNTPNFEYIPRKHSRPSAAIGDWDESDLIYVRVKVQDTGCGLTPEEKQSLFQRFQQASPRTHAQYGGSGLGLFISRQLTELHGGQIGVVSRAGEGSIFGFFISAKKASPSNDDVLASPTSDPSNRVPWRDLTQPDQMTVLSAASLAVIGHAPSTISTKSSTLPLTPPTEVLPLRVLVVEDNIVNQRVLVKQLKKAGCEVSVADNGQIALDYLETTEYRKPNGQALSVVLMDLEMPVMDGLTCVRNIRRMEAEGKIQKHLPVIAVTANVRHEQVEAARASGMDDVLFKPFQIPDLLTKVAKLLEQLDIANV